MIDAIHETTGHSIRRICEVLGVPRSSYYHAAAPTPSEVSDRDTGEQIEAVFTHHRSRYGYRRIRSELSDKGIACAPARVRRLMAQRGLRALQPRSC